MAAHGIGVSAALLIGIAALVPTATAAQYGGYAGSVYERSRPPGYYHDRGGYYDNRRDYPRRRPGDRCDRGTGGTIIGAIAGGLLGNGIAGHGDRAAGTLVGAGVGALAGRAIGRDC